MAQQFESVDDYIASFPPEVQAELQAARRTIRAAAPDAEESISYADSDLQRGWPTSRLPLRLEEAHQHLPGA